MEAKLKSIRDDIEKVKNEYGRRIEEKD